MNDHLMGCDAMQAQDGVPAVICVSLIRNGLGQITGHRTKIDKMTIQQQMAISDHTPNKGTMASH